MKTVLKTFRVTPSVLPADCESEICVEALGGWMFFYDDITYEVQFIPSDDSDIPMDDAMTLRGLEKNRKTYYVNPVGGRLKLKHYFSGEQQWNIRIRTLEYEKHEPETHTIGGAYYDGMRKRVKSWTILSVYSLYPDLYKCRALKGDLHIHTNMTDGDETPELLATEYRRDGYDFAVITDHNFYDIGKFAREKFDFKTDFMLPIGEEIHNCFDGHLHIINIGSSRSINEMFLNEPERIASEIEQLQKETKIPEGVNEKEYLYRLWVYRETKKYGGLVIFPHPYWNIDRIRWHVGPTLSMAILKNGLCDAFEIMGGGNAEQNNLQTALYYEAQKEGVNIPVVGSTDNHSVLLEKHKASTYVFTEDGDIKKAVLDGNCVALEHYEGDAVRLYGPYRLVRYSRFLTDFYFPLHKELCAASASVIQDYVHGNKELKPLVETMEKRISDFEKDFFGRND